MPLEPKLRGTRDTEYCLKNRLYNTPDFEQSSVAEWLRQWTDLGVTAPLTDWEVVGLNPTASISRIGYSIQGRNFNSFTKPKIFRIYSPHNKITLWPICSRVLLL